MVDFKIAGKSLPRHESFLKVTGQAVYTSDISLPNMLTGSILRSPHAHARVVRIDKTDAMKITGVLGILLPDDVPDILFNCSGNPPSPLLVKDERILTDHPLYAGDRIAAVVAETSDACYEAFEKIKVEYEIFPPVFTVKDALAKNAVSIHPNLAKDNVVKIITAEQGDIKQGFEKSDRVFEDSFHTPTVQHVAMETTSCVCYYTSEGKLTIWSTSQTPFQERRILSELLHIRENNIRIIKPIMGGGFGSRQQLHNQHVGALLSKQVNRPVRMINSREEDMYASTVRHESDVHLKIGVTKDGRLQAFHAKIYFNTGPYSGHGPVVAAAASRKMQYLAPHYLYEGYTVYTNAPVAGAMRGYGNPQVTFAREVMFNSIAKKLNIDPVHFRLINHVRVGDSFPPGSVPVMSCSVEECIRGAEKIKDEINREEEGLVSDNSQIVEAWGVAFGCHTSGPSSKEGMSSCIILANDDGSVRLVTGSADIGQGSETTLSQVIAEELGIEMPDVAVTAADTQNTPYDTGTFASSQMYVSGNAVLRAAENLQDNLKQALIKKYEVTPDKITCEKGKIAILFENEEKILTFKECVQKLAFGLKGTVLMGSASFKAKESPPPFAVCWAKVALDKQANTVEVKHIIEAVDAGTAINPEIVAGQVEGGIGMGFGYAMMEKVEIDKRALKPISSDLLHYKLPLSMDMPKTHVYIAKGYEPTGPFGAKSVGELSTVPVAPAIANAVSNALGLKINSLPLSEIIVPAGYRSG